MLKHRDIPLLAVIGLLPLALSACNDASSSTDPRTQSPLVRVATVATAGQAERAFTGVVAARVQSGLGFRVPGKILERLVDTGQSVKRGQPLMRIDPTDLRLATRAYEEAVAAAAALARQTAEDEARYRDLVSRGAVSASAYDKVKAAAMAARAELNAAQARAEVARNETGYAVLLADADGVVVETLAEPGQVVGAGQVVVRVAHAGAREAIIELPETLRPVIGSTGRATLYSSGQTGSATLRQLSDAANPQTRTFEARYVLEEGLANAPLGSTVSIQLATNQDPAKHDSATQRPAGSSEPALQAPMLQVPIGALYDSGKGPGVWLVEGLGSEEQGPRATWHAVKVASLSDETALVVGDLEVGDSVVALGAHLLHEGEPVRLIGNAAAYGLAVNGERAAMSESGGAALSGLGERQ
ncbi:efflux RND transporter periplasmic adaptor subunit [Marinobacterium lutimaris]|uniref:RND family efflux transporter, MFP subunit n=1 Tax=Marinobacterium lutimaris TaxID=568106 RepID=A0A1H6DTF0_9GAMM|nr:efflux RND transporter periplasmic adaptor subunit [Marinobacterium lutimaris]SEG87996.1 RND family efflux transporter, MFP subunit [Marinobacterium lutimaris]